MGVMGPREFGRYQDEVAQDMENLKTFVELTASPPAEPTVSSLTAVKRLKIDIESLRRSVGERLESMWNLDDVVRRSWQRMLDDIDVFGPTAAHDLRGEYGLHYRVTDYANGFPYHLGLGNLSAAHTLHMDLRNLATKISELASACAEYQELARS